MEINKFNQTMKYLTRPAERPGQSLEDLTVTTDLPEEGMEFQSVIEGFGESLDRNERQEFDEGGFAKGAGKVVATTGRALVGPVELPVSLAAGGVYANYQDRVDFEKAVRQTDYSENKKKDLINKFRRSQLDLDVGVGEEILVDTMGTGSDIIGGIKDPKQLRQFQTMSRDAINAIRRQEFADLEDERRDASLIEKDELF